MTRSMPEFVGIPADEAHIALDVVFVLRFFGEGGFGEFELIGKEIAQGDELDAFGGIDAVGGRSFAAAAAADEAELDGFGAGGVGEVGAKRAGASQNGGGGDPGRCFEDIAAGGLVGSAIGRHFRFLSRKRPAELDLQEIMRVAF
jgi:hypothetical protein